MLILHLSKLVIWGSSWGRGFQFHWFEATDADVLSATLRELIAAEAEVTMPAVGVEATEDGSSGFLLDYSVAVADVGPAATTLESATSSSSYILDRLTGSSGAPCGGICAALAGALGEDATVETVVAPGASFLPSVSPRCSDPPEVPFAAGSWSPRDCGGSSWWDPACTVPCQDGYRPQGAYQCNAAGEWEGTALCLPFWIAGEWQSCTSHCGRGTHSRSVSCSSGDNADCQEERPAWQETCYDYSECRWQAEPWSSCSITCGTGTRNRSVTCPSVSAHCTALAPAPATVELCRETSGCTWQVGEWSSCSSGCGAGANSRQTWCTGGADADCAAERPAGTKPCYETEACSWAPGAWSLCSSTCGAGNATRSVPCSSGQDADCAAAGDRPHGEQSCHNTSTCVWSEPAWGACSSQCGAGTRTRSPACSSGVDADCTAAARPADTGACYGTAGCAWQAGPWGSCSSTCGTGIRMRSVSCPSGATSDCAALAPQPAASAACNATSTCVWQASSWSACSEGCGEGERVRHISCSGGSDDFCLAGPRPASAETCHETGACGWVLGPWSACSASCGAGNQTRYVACETGDAADCGTAPQESAVQSCYATEGCVWAAGPWGDCDTDCGNGLRSRSVDCSSGHQADIIYYALLYDFHYLYYYY